MATSTVKFRCGADPEVLLQDKNGKLISAIGMIGAGKLDPYQIPNMPAGFTLQEDNVTLEYGIPPAASAKEFSEYIENVMLQSLAYVKGCSFSKLSCAIYEPDQMQHPAAHVFGCEPDFNAWTKDYNPGPQPPHPFMRSAGGHVHVETKLDPIRVVRAMDLFLGVPSVLMDKGDERRKLYGKAGAHRPKSYGVEYRTLSNFWIFEDTLREWVWRATEEALSHLDWAEEVGEEIQRSINFGDRGLARELVDAYKLETV